MKTEINVRRAISYQDFFQVACLHKNCISTGFLSTFDSEVLAALYRSISESGGGVVLVAVDETGCVGFATGTWDMKTVYRWFLLHHPVQVGVVAWKILHSFKRWKKSLQTIRYSGKNVGSRAELTSIGVDTQCRKEGIGTMLYQALMREFKERGFHCFYITVGESLTGAHTFYSRMGAEPVGKVRIHDETTSILYRHLIQR